jgi:hypothetical protein
MGDSSIKEFLEQCSCHCCAIENLVLQILDEGNVLDFLGSIIISSEFLNFVEFLGILTQSNSVCVSYVLTCI